MLVILLGQGPQWKSGSGSGLYSGGLTLEHSTEV